MIKGGLAWLFWQVGGVVFDVVEHTNIGSGLEVYWKEVTEGNTINNRATKASLNITRQYAVLGVP